jgi:hypothetical protein
MSLDQISLDSILKQRGQIRATLRIVVRIGSGFNQVYGSGSGSEPGSGSRRAKITHKNVNKVKKSHEVLYVLFEG